MAPTPNSPLVQYNHNNMMNPFFQMDHPMSLESVEFQKHVEDVQKRHTKLRENFNKQFQEMVSKEMSFFNNQIDFHENNHNSFNLIDRFNDVSLFNQNKSLFNIEDDFSSTNDKKCAVKEDQSEYQITIDVSGFDASEIHVKLVEENELVIEGKSSTQEFKRSYQLPCLTENSSIKCQRSTNNILTITIGKDKNTMAINPRSVSINSPSKNSAAIKESVNSSTSNNNLRSQSGFKSSHNQSSNKNEKINNPKTESSAIRPRSVKTVNTHMGPIQVFDSTSNDETTTNINTTTKIDNERNNNSSINSNTKVNKELNTMDIVPSFMGPFFHDRFFNDMQDDYHNAVSSVLHDFNQSPSTWIENLNKYHDLRAFNQNADNRAVRHTEDETSHKIVLDVKGYKTDNLSIKIDDSNTLVIEGQLDDNTTNSSINKSFKHMFNVSSYDTNNVTSALSQDGVLTIRIMKKNSPVAMIESMERTL